MTQLELPGWSAEPPVTPAPTQKNDLDALLRAVISEARAVGVPVSGRILPHVVINKRAKTRFGCCKKSGLRFAIELAAQLETGPEHSCRQVLAHEILHTCAGCRNHGTRWRSYARRMQEAYGYAIARTDSFEQLGIESRAVVKYVVVCTSCGREFARLRASKLTQHPERYRCQCGGALRLQP